MKYDEIQLKVRRKKVLSNRRYNIVYHRMQVKTKSNTLWIKVRNPMS